MTLSTRPYKGTRDFYPEEMALRNWMFSRMREVVSLYGFQEYDGPMLEPFELYAAKTGEEIVNKQLYWLMDQGERKLAVRPEMTPTLARMVAGKLQELPKPIRWFSLPNLWRYERPQRGRLREHWQLNVDVLGGDPLLADAEILCLALDLMKAFGGEDLVRIQVNNRRLMDQFFKEKLGLKSDAALAVTKAIDARSKIGEEEYRTWLEKLGLNTKSISELDSFFKMSFQELSKAYPGPGTEELKTLFQLLEESGKSKQVVFDPTILRGLDYYTGTVFEMYDTSPENNRAMFGGGRYDNLIGLFGKEQLSGVGFGMGDVTLQNFIETHGLGPKEEKGFDVFVSLPSLDFRKEAESIAQNLRGAGFSVVTPLSEGSFKNQLKQADRFKTHYAVLFGDEEWKSRKVVLKNLKSKEQKTVSVSDLVSVLKKENQ